ncbi:hypothetical protein [Aeromonas diversa]|uniref:hypothetical protein n=1 Tax=Aeromonas diversa TaxID=502790 RepID=UPI0034630A4C
MLVIYRNRFFMMATKEDFKNGLLKLRDKGRFRNTQYLNILKAQAKSKNFTITATQIAEHVGYANYNAANLQYGKLGHELAEVLGYTPPKRSNGETMWFWTLSTGNEASKDAIDGHYEFVMRPELAAALKEMNWVR